jgi:hypothetical protein
MYRVDERRVILRRGHIGQHFYFIYSGSVFVNVQEENGQGEKFLKTEVVFSKGDSFGVSWNYKSLLKLCVTQSDLCSITVAMLLVESRDQAHVCCLLAVKNKLGVV